MAAKHEFPSTFTQPELQAAFLAQHPNLHSYFHLPSLPPLDQLSIEGDIPYLEPQLEVLYKLLSSDSNDPLAHSIKSLIAFLEPRAQSFTWIIDQLDQDEPSSLSKFLEVVNTPIPTSSPDIAFRDLNQTAINLRQALIEHQHVNSRVELDYYFRQIYRQKLNQIVDITLKHFPDKDKEAYYILEKTDETGATQWLINKMRQKHLVSIQKAGINTHHLWQKYHDLNSRAIDSQVKPNRTINPHQLTQDIEQSQHLSDELVNHVHVLNQDQVERIMSIFDKLDQEFVTAAHLLPIEPILSSAKALAHTLNESCCQSEGIRITNLIDQARKSEQNFNKHQSPDEALDLSWSLSNLDSTLKENSQKFLLTPEKLTNLGDILRCFTALSNPNETVSKNAKSTFNNLHTILLSYIQRIIYHPTKLFQRDSSGSHIINQTQVNKHLDGLAHRVRALPLSDTLRNHITTIAVNQLTTLITTQLTLTNLEQQTNRSKTASIHDQVVDATNKLVNIFMEHHRILKDTHVMPFETELSWLSIANELNDFMHMADQYLGTTNIYTKSHRSQIIKTIVSLHKLDLPNIARLFTAYASGGQLMFGTRIRWHHFKKQFSDPLTKYSQLPPHSSPGHVLAYATIKTAQIPKYFFHLIDDRIQSLADDLK